MSQRMELWGRGFFKSINTGPPGALSILHCFNLFGEGELRGRDVGCLSISWDRESLVTFRCWTERKHYWWMKYLNLCVWFVVICLCSAYNFPRLLNYPSPKPYKLLSLSRSNCYKSPSSSLSSWSSLKSPSASSSLSLSSIGLLYSADAIQVQLLYIYRTSSTTTSTMSTL